MWSGQRQVLFKRCNYKAQASCGLAIVYTSCLSIFRFHQFSSMNFRGQFQISWVGTSLFSGGTVYIYVLMALYPELGVYSCWIIDSQPVVQNTRYTATSSVIVLSEAASYVDGCIAGRLVEVFLGQLSIGSCIQFKIYIYNYQLNFSMV